ncbi:MAG: rhomboid family intramembrane serine protease [Anaeromyxobacter sp.]
MAYRRSRRTTDLGRMLTFGGRVPQSIGLLLVLMLGLSVLGWLLRVGGEASLNPPAVYPGLELWRLVSWVFVQDHPLTLFFGGLALWSFGSQLLFTMGERRFLSVFLWLTAGSAVVTCLVAQLVVPANVPHLGMWPVVNALILIWSMRFPDQPVSLFFGALPMNGRMLGYLIVFGTVLWGLFAGGLGGLFVFTVHFAALGIAWAYAGGRLRLPLRRWTGGLREWWSEQSFKRRSRHLKVVKKNGQEGPPRWMN